MRMRLWHYDIIEYLPNLQLIAQWRELNSIFKNHPNHILINYVYDYPKGVLKTYTDLILSEMRSRHIKIKSMKNYNEYFKDVKSQYRVFLEHDDYYLNACYWNLTEKYLRGQKGYDFTTWDNMNKGLQKFLKRGVLNEG